MDNKDRPNEMVIEVPKLDTFGSGRTVSEKLSPEKVVPFIRGRFSGRIEPFRARAPEISRELSFAVSLAEKEVEKYHKLVFEADLPQDKMKSLFLNPDDFLEFLGRTFGIKDLNTKAISAHPMDTVFIKKDPNFFEHELAVSDFHELMHQTLDVGVFLFAHEDSDSEPNQVNVRYEQRRSGLATHRMFHTRLRDRGELVNEMGNRFFEAVFRERILNEPLFANEKEQREVYIEQFRQKNGLNSEERALQRGFGTEASLDPRNIVFRKDGGYEFDKGVYVTQLVQDLATVVGKVNNEDFSVLLLRAKANPKLQNTIREAVDEKMGAGFYGKLRSFDYQRNGELELLNLLAEVQGKLPNLSESSRTEV